MLSFFWCANLEKIVDSCSLIVVRFFGAISSCSLYLFMLNLFQYLFDVTVTILKILKQVQHKKDAAAIWAMAFF